MEKAKLTENLALRRGSGRTRPDLRQTYRSQGTNDPVLYCFHFFFSQLDEPRARVRHKTGRFLVLIYHILFSLLSKSFNFSHIATIGSVQKRAPSEWTKRDHERTSRLTTVHCTGPPIVISNYLGQTLDGKFGDGKSEAHGKYSAKEGVRPNGPARPQTHMQVICFILYHIFWKTYPDDTASWQSRGRK